VNAHIREHRPSWTQTIQDRSLSLSLQKEQKNKINLVFKKKEKVCELTTHAAFETRPYQFDPGFILELEAFVEP
jgi:hypothetical protein